VVSTHACCASGAPSRYPYDASSISLLDQANCPVWLIDRIDPTAAIPSTSGALSTNLPAG
jgi:hypothetical protein